jgi:Co/Zn/Cd efflux system component
MRRNQKGASYIGFLIAIIGFAFLAKVAIAVWAPYWDDRVIDSQITELLQSSPKDISPDKFNTQMEQRLTMNNIRDVNFKDIAQVTNTDGIQVQKSYEVRKPFLLNIDLVLKFEKSFDQRSVQTK